MTQKTLAQGAEATIYLVTPSSDPTLRSKKSSTLNKSQQSVVTKSDAKQIISSEARQFIIKDRIKKSYRIEELDNKIRKQRTKKEIKLLTKAAQIINCPLPINNSSQGGASDFARETKTNNNERVRELGGEKITMPFIDGKKLSEHLDEFPLAKQKQICKQIGQDVAKLHNTDIIHGDLTTSNMILVEPNLSPSNPSKKISTLIKSPAKKSGKADFVATNSRATARVYFIDFGLGFISRKIEDKAVDIHLLRQALEAKHFKHWESLFKEFLKGYKTNPEVKKIVERLKAVEKRGRYKH